MNRSFKYGDGFFETIRVETGQPTLWPYHVDRILSSCDLLRLNLPDTDEINGILESILEECRGVQLARARVTFYRSGNGGYLPESSEVSYHLAIDPLEADPNALFPTHTGSFDDLLRDVRNLPARKAGLYASASVHFTPFSMLKSTSSLLYVQAALHAGDMGWDDAFIINDKGNVIETTTSNVYAVYGDRIYTPSLRSGCVAGVCRAYLIDRYDFLLAPISWDDLQSADLIFQSNALHGVRRLELA